VPDRSRVTGITQSVQKPTQERLRVRYGETDMMGHAYYANYLYWFEQARGAWCRDRGFTYKGLEEMGFRLPVVEVWVRYKGEVKYDDWVVVNVWIAERKRAAVKFAYEVVNEETGQVVTEGSTWHVFVGSEMKAVTIPPEVQAMLERDPAEWDTLV
jgi:acyl-CoA thioester hydrolase